MKKCMSILLILIMILSVFTVVSMQFSAEGIDKSATGDCDPSYPDFNYVVLSDGTAEISQYQGEEADVDIPSSLGGYTVTSIGEKAFIRCYGVTTVTIPDSVTKINYCAFWACWSLTSVTIPDSVTIIDGYAFYGCKSLPSIMIPDSVLSIGRNAFDNCVSLSSVTISDSVISIGVHAFFDCTSLKSVTIPDSVLSIGDLAFGYKSVNEWNYGKVNDYTIYGYPESEAEKYADYYDFPFIPLSIPCLLGDADGDGEVTSIDVTLVQRYNAWMDTGIDEDVLMNADVDGNGELEIVDATYIQRYLAYMDTPYAIGEEK